MKTALLRIASALAGGAALIALLTLPVSRVEGGEDDSNQRGFVASRAYALDEFDSINLFTGNLTATIPIGDSYPIGPGLSFSLVLSYNSEIWDHDHELSVFQRPFFGLDKSEPGDRNPGRPADLSNAGLGWRLSLGELIEPRAPSEWDGWNDMQAWRYVSPDGATHTFRSSLHWGVAETESGTSEPESPEVDDSTWCAGPSQYCFTSDSTYLRLSAGASGTMRLEFPDGTTHLFLPSQRDPGIWRPALIHDHFGNFISVDYQEADPESPPVWVIGDSRGRSYEIRFVDDPYSPGLRFGYLVNEVDLPAPGGGRTVYQFAYTGTNPILPGCAGPSTTPPPRLQLPLLVAVIQSMAGDIWSYGFEYLPDDGGEFCSHTSGKLSAVILPTRGRVEYGYGEYFHGWTDCRVGPGDGDRPESPSALPRTHGVVSKVIYDAPPNQATVLRRWELQYGSRYVPDSPCNEFRKPWGGMSYVTFEELGDDNVARTESFFSVWSEHFPGSWNNEGWDTVEFGQPFTREEMVLPIPDECPDGHCNNVVNPWLVVEQGEEVPYYLSRLVHRCAASDRDSPQPLVPRPDGRGKIRPLDPSCRLHRVYYVRYERSPSGGCNHIGQPGCRDVNWRRAGEVEVFADDFYTTTDPGTGQQVNQRAFRVNSSADFTGFGPYRQSILDANFGAASFGPGGGNVTVTTTTNHAPAGSYPDTMPDPSSVSPWQFTRYDSIIQREQNAGLDQTARTEYCFDASNGFLLGQRTLKEGSGARSPGDLVVKFEPTADGFVDAEYHYGGDIQTVSVGDDLCAQPDPGAAEYAIDNEYQYGVLQSSWFQRNGQDFLRRVEYTLDPTGLVTQSRDVSGITTDYGYDERGRLTEIEPTGRATTTIVYDTLASSGPQVTLERRDGSTLLRTERYDYDGLGRLTEERRRVLLPPPPGSPPGTPAQPRDVVRRTRYHSGGLLESQSEWRDPQEPELLTLYKDYDPFGRVGLVRAPELSAPFDIAYHYRGARSKRTRRYYWDATGGFSQVDQWDDSDPLGRLISVNVDSGALIARYRYDVGSRLSRVEIEGSPDQIRLFNYDRRGFLVSETSPEIGPNGNGTICHGQAAGGQCAGRYDSMGHPERRVFMGTSDPSFDLAYRYNAAGRLTQVLRQGEPWKEYFYAANNAGNDKRKGKLVQAKRRNQVAAAHGATGGTGQVVVTESFRYVDLAGRLTEREVRSSDGLVAKTSATYDPLNNVDVVTYPACTYPNACAAALPVRAVDHDYAFGLLSEVVGFAPSITYHPSGMWAEVHHSNQTMDGQNLHLGGMPLPERIFTLKSDLSQRLNLGPYLYDGFRNIRQIGGPTPEATFDEFAYDSLGRLVRATLSTPQTADRPTQTYTYDRFSNLLSVTTQTTLEPNPWPSRSMPASAATNRLVGPEYAYDQAGNLLRHVAGAPPRVFDAFNMLVHEQGEGVNRDLLYTVDDERVAILDRLLGREHWTLRGLDQRMLRDLEANPAFSAWNWKKDYVYRGRGLLAAVVPPGGSGDVLHYHLDHLGSVRTVTDANGDWAFQAPGQGLRYLKHWPYGDLLDGFNRESERLRFTGHERDFNCPVGTCEGVAAQADDLDYMHARYYSPWLGRFLSVDPLTGRTGRAQSWNRYSYAWSNPVVLVDQDGQDVDSPAQGYIVRGGPDLAFFTGQLGVGQIESVHRIQAHGNQYVRRDTATVVETKLAARVNLATVVKKVGRIATSLGRAGRAILTFQNPLTVEPGQTETEVSAGVVGASGIALQSGDVNDVAATSTSLEATVFGYGVSFDLSTGEVAPISPVGPSGLLDIGLTFEMTARGVVDSQSQATQVPPAVPLVSTPTCGWFTCVPGPYPEGAK